MRQEPGKLTRFFCRKNLLTSSTAGQPISTEAELRCKLVANNPMSVGTADLRRPSSGSVISSSSVDGSPSFLSNSALESHVPHMICKFCAIALTRILRRLMPALALIGSEAVCALLENLPSPHSQPLTHLFLLAPHRLTPNHHHMKFNDMRTMMMRFWLTERPQTNAQAIVTMPYYPASSL